MSSTAERIENKHQTLLVGFYRTMTRIAETDKAVQRALSSGEIQMQYYPAGGQEAIAAGVGALLRPDDYMVITYRCIHDIIAKGTAISEILAELFGKIEGTSKGKGGPMHLCDPKAGLMVTTGIVGGGVPIANGLAVASQLRGTDQVTVVSFGDGATSTGAFHEAINLAAVWNLPVVFLCQNNLYAEYSSISDFTKNEDFSSRGKNYGMPGVRVDGTDPLAVYQAAQTAIKRARGGSGPTLIEAVCHRLQGHAFGSDEDHMDAVSLAKARANTPLSNLRKRLVTEKLALTSELDAIDADAREEVSSAMAFARAGRVPEAAELYKDVFHDAASIPELDTRAPSAASMTVLPEGTRQITFSAAISETLDQALTRDLRVFLLGEDIADPAGGVIKVTAGLSTKFGKDRVRVTPISESAIVGAAIGAALSGMRPVAEIMVNDFLEVCMDQVANHAAKLRYMSGGRTSVPLTIRTPSAGHAGSFGAQHSQSLEAWLTHTPGLKVVYPSTPYDAKGLLRTCIEDDDPCVFFEPMRAYFNKGPVPEAEYKIPFGVADIKRRGKDLTIVTYGWTVLESLVVAESLASEGIDIEVLDLRTLVPLDRPALLESVGRTGRALVVHSGIEFSGFGAEIGMILHSSLHRSLKKPVGRVGGRYTPIPFASSLDVLHFPTQERIMAAVRDLMK